MKKYIGIIFAIVIILFLIPFAETFINSSSFQQKKLSNGKTPFYPLDLINVMKEGSFKLGNFTFDIKTRVNGENLVLTIINEEKNYYRHFIFPNFLAKIKKIPSANFLSYPKYFSIADSRGNIQNFYIANKPEEIAKFLEDLQRKEKNYIIEFKEEPLLAKKINLQKEIEDREIELLLKRDLLEKQEILTIEEEIQSLKENFPKELRDYKDHLQKTHAEVKEEISKILNKRSEEIEVREFTNIFNGIVLKVSEKVLEEIKKLPNVKRVYEDREVRAFLNESVPMINATRVWQILDSEGRNITGQGIKIAIIDTGVDYTHADLGGCFGPTCKVIGGWDFVNNDADPMDDQGHGTHVAAIAASYGKFKGVAPGAKILAYKVLDEFGSGYESDVIAGVEKAVEDGANVISMSLGISYYYFENCYDVTLSTVVDNAVDAGVVVVVAAGNEGPEYQTIAAPGCAKKVITIGATDKTDTIADFSSKGPHVSRNETIPKPDVVAPGVSICAAQWDDAWPTKKCDVAHVSLSGTSMSTPHIAGVAALLLQAYPNWKPADVKSAIMLGSIDLGYDTATQGAGRIDTLKAHNTSILTYPSSIGMSLTKIPTGNTTIKIKNLRNYPLTINFTLPNATDTEGNSFNISLLNVSFITLPANGETEVLFSINLTGLGGAFFGKIIITAESRNSTIPYAATRFFELNITVVGDALSLYPDICVHDDDGEITTCKWQGWDFIGNSYSFLVSSLRNYTAYAYGDWENESLEYILMNRSYLGEEPITIFLNLSKARAFNVRAKSLDNVDLKLYEWERVFLSYINATEFILGVSVEDDTGVIGNRIIYLSDKPISPVHTDIILRYTGVPVRR